MLTRKSNHKKREFFLVLLRTYIDIGSKSIHFLLYCT
jgi:hypothetical protein